MQIHGEKIRFGIYAAQQHTTFAEYSELWRRCEELGYDWVACFDHFIPIRSDPTGPCFEGTTTIAAMAAQTERVRCAMLVTGVTYRHPAVAANVAATIDHISGGRYEHGVGAAWHQLEHDQYGIPLPPIGVRMDMLDEACRVMRGLWTHESFSFEGKHYQLKDAWLEPKPVQEHLPLVIGGGGKQRLLRIVAEHADIWNYFAEPVDDYRQRLDVLKGHCVDVGRDYGDVRKSLALAQAFLAGTEAEAQDKWREMTGAGPATPVQLTIPVGTPEQCVEILEPFAEMGVRDFLLRVETPYDYETIELFATQVAPALRG